MLASGRARRAVALAVVLLAATPLVAGVAAAEDRVGGTIVVGDGETVTGGLQAASGTVVVRGTVNGDLRAFAGSVVVAESGTVTGDLTGAAGSVRIAGAVDGNVEVTAGSVLVTESGVVGGNVEAGAGSFTLAGTVAGSVRVGADSITLAPSASVDGDFVYDGALSRADGATVAGELREDPSLSVSAVPGLPSVADWLFTAYSLLLTAVVGALLLLVFPGVSATVADSTATAPLRTLGAGLLALVGTPLVAAVLFVTIVGIPLGLLVVLLYVLVVLLSFVWGEYALGAWLVSLAGRENRWLALVVGILVVFVVSRAPLLGGLLEFAVLLFGLGGVATAAYRYVQRRRNGSEPRTPVADADTGGDAGA